ncbi:hypothetical protein AQUCO_02200345v1 [Aquilegia coerulea]|uniref:Protein IDA-LIKE 2 n=1 Tax=Aquilegia coerulea TaxID=218851 RepID=A0A2G5DEA7_AQUCA|nr:hypothetical protein AQUCO_02200345v1 [Aquilegia coerulea]
MIKMRSSPCYTRALSMLLFFFFFLSIFFAGFCHGTSRSNSQLLKISPRSQNYNGYFYGFLPKAMPIPPSGPSKQHNDIGLQSRQQSP